MEGRNTKKSFDSESFDQNKSAFTAGLLEILLGSSIPLTELCFEQHDRKACLRSVGVLYMLHILIQKDFKSFMQR